MYWVIVASGVVLAVLTFYLDKNFRQTRRVRIPVRIEQRRRIRKS